MVVGGVATTTKRVLDADKFFLVLFLDVDGLSFFIYCCPFFFHGTLFQCILMYLRVPTATVYDYMTGEGAPPPEIRLTVCRLLVQMSKLDSQIGVMIMSERWGDLSFLMAQIHTGVGEAMTPIVEDGEDAKHEKEEDTEQRMQALFAWFLLLSQLFTSTQDYGYVFRLKWPQAQVLHTIY